VDARALLLAYVEAHNEGWRTGNFARLGQLLDAECELRFKVARAGPFLGRAAIVRAFERDPPGADLHVVGVTGDEARAQAHYGWVGAAASFSGTLTIEAGPQGIRRIDVREFGP
jgi:hypothetical protein